jgi:hypothetical protein
MLGQHERFARGVQALAPLFVCVGRCVGHCVGQSPSMLIRRWRVEAAVDKQHHANKMY